MLRTICDALVRTSTGEMRNNVAIVDGARRVTYVELLERAQSTAALLTDRGLRKGDRVVIFLPRSFDAVVALFATWFAGGVAVIANEHLRTMQVRHIIEHSDCSLVLTDTRQILAVGRLPYERVMNIDQIDPPSQAYPPASIIGADLALLIYTSGSTGLPKGVMLSHDNLLSGAEIVSSYLHLSDRDVILSVLPFSFDYGLNQLLTRHPGWRHAGAATLAVPTGYLPDARAGTDHRPCGRAHTVAATDRETVAVSEGGFSAPSVHHEFRRPFARVDGQDDPRGAS